MLTTTPLDVSEIKCKEEGGLYGSDCQPDITRVKAALYSHLGLKHPEQLNQFRRCCRLLENDYSTQRKPLAFWEDETELSDSRSVPSPNAPDSEYTQHLSESGGSSSSYHSAAEIHHEPGTRPPNPQTPMSKFLSWSSQLILSPFRKISAVYSPKIVKKEDCFARDSRCKMDIPVIDHDEIVTLQQAVSSPATPAILLLANRNNETLSLNSKKCGELNAAQMDGINSYYAKSPVSPRPGSRFNNQRVCSDDDDEEEEDVNEEALTMHSVRRHRRAIILSSSSSSSSSMVVKSDDSGDGSSVDLPSPTSLFRARKERILKQRSEGRIKQINCPSTASAAETKGNFDLNTISHAVQEIECTKPTPSSKPLTSTSNPEVWEPQASPPWRKMLVPTATSSAKKCNQTPATYDFIQRRESLTLDLFSRFDEDIFGGVLAHLTTITWSKTLNKTAGRTHMIRQPGKEDGQTKYTARIELSTKVLDTLFKLRNTLAHEMCHAAVWIVYHSNVSPHGPLFQEWGRRCEVVYADLVIKTCHDYEIAYKFNYRCTNAVCNRVYGRHSKSINVNTHACGYCRGKLMLEY